MIALSSTVVGICTADRLETLDIVFHLATIGAAQTVDPSHFSLHGMMSEGEGIVTRADLIHEIRRLPFAERVELLEELWIEAERERPQLLEWQKELLDQRLKGRGGAS